MDLQISDLGLGFFFFFLFFSFLFFWRGGLLAFQGFSWDCQQLDLQIGKLGKRWVYEWDLVAHSGPSGLRNSAGI